MPEAPTCRFCGEDIAAGAPKCPHCGESLGERRPRPSQGDARLKIAAMVQLMLGGLVGLLVPCAIFGLIMQAQILPPGQRQSAVAGMAGVGIYGALAVFFLVTGVGAWKHRRWVRPIMLAVSAPGLAVGVLSFAVMCVVLPTMMQMTQGFATQGPGAAPPPGVMTGVMVFTLGFAFLAYIGLPALFVGLYWSPRLQEICEQIDGTPRWTDGVPIPVLGTSLWLGFMAACSLIIPVYNVSPLFGMLLSGWPVYLFALALLGSSGGLCYAVFKRHPLGWYGTVALVLLLGTSHVLTFSQVEMIEFYRAMGTMPPQQMEILEGMDLRPIGQAALGVGGAAILVALGFLFYLRRYFVAAPGGMLPSEGSP